MANTRHSAPVLWNLNPQDRRSRSDKEAFIQLKTGGRLGEVAKEWAAVTHSWKRGTAVDWQQGPGLGILM